MKENGFRLDLLIISRCDSTARITTNLIQVWNVQSEKNGQLFRWQDGIIAIYRCREGSPRPGGFGEGTEVVNSDILANINIYKAILTLSSLYRTARRFPLHVLSPLRVISMAPLWRRRQKVKWRPAEMAVKWTSSFLLSVEAEACTKSGSYLKQYLVSEWIPEDCDATIVEVLTAESKDFYIWWSSNETL